LTKKVIWYFSPSLLSGVLGVASLYLLTSYLNVNQFGQIELFLVILLALKYILGFGWDSSLIRFYNDKNENKYDIASSIFIFRAVLHILAIILFYFFSDFFLSLLKIDKNFLDLFWIILAIFILEDYLSFFILIFRSENQAKSFGILQISQHILIFILLVIFILNLDLKIYALFYSYFFAKIIILLIAIVKYKKYLLKKQKLDVFINIKKSFNFGFPLVFAAISFFVINFSDRYMLNLLLEENLALKEIGFYSFYTKIATSFLMFLIIFRMIWSPLVIKYYKYINYKKIFKYLVLFFVTLSISIALFVSLFSYEILSIFSGNDDYLLKHNSLALVFITQILILLGDYTPIGIDIKKKTIYRSIFATLFAIVNIILNYLFIPLYMLEGALIASILSMLGYVVLINVLSYKLYKLSLNYFEFLVGLIPLIGMYYFSEIDFIDRIYIFLIFGVLIGFYIKKNFENFKLCFITLKKNKIL
tara:strand:- start:24892 stop:26319 length:1428 start_codon:yes stop_codon:yes gene_type:complete